MNAIKEILKEKIYAVVRIDDGEKVVEIAQSLVKGGIKIIEIIVNNSSVADAIKYLNSSEDLMIAAGGIITQRQATLAINAGAKLIVSPIFQMNLVRLCQSNQVPLIMTATTPNEAYSAWKARTPLIKIYPTRPMGGATYIEDLLRPMPFLNIVATGNIEIEGFTDYLEAGAGAVGIGRALYQNASNEEIIYRAMKTKEILKTYLEKKSEL